MHLQTSWFKSCFFIAVSFFATILFAENDNTPATLCSNSLANFSLNPPEVKKLIEMSLELAGKKISYQYGSSDPKARGMDCSGTVHYLLTQLGIKSAPRSANDLYRWVTKDGIFYPVAHSDNDLSHLKPGDLLFWTGTYKASNPSHVTHVMIYLGTNQQGTPLMVGASDGRTYKGRRINGVSVFDFLMPRTTSQSKFIGYSCIPNINCSKL